MELTEVCRVAVDMHCECASTVTWHTVAVQHGDLEGTEGWKEWLVRYPSKFQGGSCTGRVQTRPHEQHNVGARGNILMVSMGGAVLKCSRRGCWNECWMQPDAHTLGVELHTACNR